VSPAVVVAEKPKSDTQIKLGAGGLGGDTRALASLEALVGQLERAKSAKCIIFVGISPCGWHRGVISGVRRARGVD
jgi:hypothetical protein